MLRPLLTAALVTLPLHAAAQTLPCALREVVLTHLIDGLHMQRLTSGVTARGARVEVFATEGGDWAIIVHLPGERSCLLAEGDGFEATQGVQPARGNPA